MSEIGDSSGSAPRSFTIDAATPELIELRPLPRRAPAWLKTGLAAVGLGVAVIGWSLYDGAGREHIETSILPPLSSDHEQAEIELAHGKGLEQHAAVGHNGRDPLVHDLLARERARAKALEQQAAGSAGDREPLAHERARREEAERQLANERDLLARERARSRQLEHRLADERVRSSELEQQLVLRHSDRDLVAREWARSQELGQQLAAFRGDDRDLLALERARNKELEQQLMQPGDWPAMAPPQRLANADAARLIARARLLITQGDIAGARMVLERAAEAGNAPAVFVLAETYDSAVLSAWGTFGTQGDSVRAQQLYAEALAGGIQEAKARLKAP